MLAPQLSDVEDDKLFTDQLIDGHGDPFNPAVRYSRHARFLGVRIAVGDAVRVADQVLVIKCILHVSGASDWGVFGFILISDEFDRCPGLTRHSQQFQRSARAVAVQPLEYDLVGTWHFRDDDHMVVLI